MKLDPNTSEWINLFARWFHVFTGILWIGQTYLFTWLDGQLAGDKAKAEADTPGQVWMVHSGGFYVVEKQKMPGKHRLHWFRYEALLTWVSGMLLLTLVYYMGGALTDPDISDAFVAKVNGWTGGYLKNVFDLSAHYEGFVISVGLGLLLVAWLVYDLMCLSPLAKSEILFAVVSYLLILCVAYGLSRVMSGRAAYIHVGAMFGTIMAANVWMRILPAQRRMIAAVREGNKPDETLAARAKLRSKHNTYMVVPLVFTMISNHFPSATYGDKYNWAILMVLILAGWGAAHLIRRA